MIEELKQIVNISPHIMKFNIELDKNKQKLLCSDKVFYFLLDLYYL